MKNKKIIALILCAALLTGTIAATIQATGNTTDNDTVVEENTETENVPLFLENDESDNTVKDESAYVLANTDGSVKKIIVSDWLKNTQKSDTITDTSALAGVENVKGDETYTDNGSARVWDAEGNDIYYTGTIESELPVDMEVTYTLDGEPIDASELAGKSGKVTITFAYTNKQYENVTIDGKTEKIYVPFAMLTGMLVDSDTFRNIEVTNGKILNDGDRTAIVGIAFPGLQDNLGVDRDTVDIPDSFTVSADVTDFHLTNTVTIAASGLFSNLNPEKFDSVSELTDSLEQLNDAMEQLMDGSSQLYDGLCTLLSKSQELTAGIDALAEGAGKLKEGGESLTSGAAALSEGTKSLSDGLGQLAGNSDALNGGAATVFESLLTMANTQLAAAGLDVPELTIDNYAAVLDGVVASLDTDTISQTAENTARQKVTEAVNAKSDEITAAVTEAVRTEVNAQVTEAVRDTVTEQVLSAMGMTKEQYDAALAAGAVNSETQTKLTAAVDTQMADESIVSTIAAKTDEQMASETVQQLIAQKTEEQKAALIEQNMASDTVQEQIQAALESAESGVQSIQNLREQLDSYNTFYVGLQQYTAGVASAKAGADELTSGAETLYNGTVSLSDGINTMYDGILTMQNGVPALVEGVTELRDGAMSLSDGLTEFNEKGISKLTELLDGDLTGLAERLRATVEAAQNYTSFSGISDDMDGEVKFIYRTDSIG
jgi:putative membrane protein